MGAGPVSIVERLRGTSLSSILLHGMPTQVKPKPAPPAPLTYTDARAEALQVCCQVGLAYEAHDVFNVGDLLRLAYRQGEVAAAARLAAPDTADAIAQAIENPASIVHRTYNESVAAHTTRAVRRVVVHGVPKPREETSIDVSGKNVGGWA